MSLTPIELCIDAAHPALPGHFPGHPVVPGVVLLERVVTALAERDITVTGVRKLKFLVPVQPGQALQLRLGEPGGDSLRFKLVEPVSQVVLAEGNLDLAPRGEAW